MKSNITFSKTANRLIFGTAPIPAAKDTTLIDIDLVKLDIWHYNDDYLQTQQLINLQNDLRRNYLAVYDFKQAGTIGIRSITTVMPAMKAMGVFCSHYRYRTACRIAMERTNTKDVYAVK